ncbi:WXG100 family type VII secretion target [Streptomyces phyllanthi]|uniref:WXG100 family type VII secretion target n=1 Tax=Streptomyces phyllanthi TaxID=1803180 RepID=A0A5N8W0A5_9ACTN|nr:hypothetical protein [Streptomyces phyllanthi]MPY40512.1 hypothetical protein [Streptomyces phyllanthi]
MPINADYNGDGFISNGEAMRGAMDAVIAASNAVGQSLDYLEGEIYKTLAGWESEGVDGGAKKVYTDNQARWDAAAKDLQGFLTVAGQGIGQVADIYQQQDLQAMRTLGG